jgi:hypothetical protein
MEFSLVLFFTFLAILFCEIEKEWKHIVGEVLLPVSIK